MAAAEAREFAAKKAATVVPPQTRGALPVDPMKDLIEQRTNYVKFMLPQTAPRTEQRTDMTTVDTTGYIGVYTDPQSWYDSVRMFAIAQTGVLAAGPTILRTGNGDQINIPKGHRRDGRGGR